MILSIEQPEPVRPMSEQRGGISDEKVREATGRTPAEWEVELDARGAADFSHKQMVAQLKEAGVESGWWRQMLAVDYERRKGKRAVGQTVAAGFNLGVQRTLPLPADEAWRLLTSAEGVQAWLGGAPPRWEKGEAYRLRDGSSGEVRVFTPGSHLRITWQPEGWTRPSIIQVRVTPAGERKTVVTFHQEHLPGTAARDERRRFFESAFDALRERWRRDGVME